MRVLDANLIIYAYTRSAPQHKEASSWMARIYSEDDLVGLPRISLLAFLRIVTNPRLASVAIPTEVAVARVDTLLAHPKSVVLEAGTKHWAIFKDLVDSAGIFGPSMTDAHLAALAIEHGSTLCSHDEGFRRFAGLKFENPLAHRRP